jgi:hypothetical protein
MAYNYKQGYYTPKHPEKYIGDVNKIIYRSSYELEVNQFFDNNPRVLKWASEEIAIPYFNPVKHKVANYYPDYYVKYVTKDGEVIEEIVEIKPHQQTRRSASRNSRTKLYEDLTYAVNMAKWEAATAWCEKRGFKFRVVTERKIFK